MFLLPFIILCQDILKNISHPAENETKSPSAMHDNEEEKGLLAQCLQRFAIILLGFNVIDINLKIVFSIIAGFSVPPHADLQSLPIENVYMNLSFFSLWNLIDMPSYSSHCIAIVFCSV